MKGIKLQTATLLMTALFFLSACARDRQFPEAPVYYPLPDGQFPIGAGYALRHPYMTDTQMEWVKEAGFNVVRSSLSLEDTDSLLRLANKYDMYVTLYPWGLGDPAKTQMIVERYNADPAVWGYGLWDEPNASKFDELKEVNERVTEYATGNNTFINLLPAVSPKQLGAPDYRSYVEEYVATVNPAYISLDIYPVKFRGKGEIYIDPVLYTTMETIRDVAQASGRPFWSYILSNKHWNYPKPKEEYIRFSVFTALAYGAQGLTYYTYLMPEFDKDKGEYSDAPIDWNGKRTKTWNMVKNVNREVQNLAEIFLGAEVTDVTQTGERIPQGTKRNYRMPAPFRGIESYGEGVTVSQFRNGEKEYLLLVSRDVENKQKVRLPRSRAVTRIYGNGTRREESATTVTLAPGGYALYLLN